MNSFMSAFCHHFHHEIDHITGLYEIAEEIGAERISEAEGSFSVWAKKSVKGAPMSDILPFMLFNFDRTAEEGMWKDWPQMWAPMKWITINIAGAWYSGYWKFSSCTSDGRPRTLYALRDRPVSDGSVNRNSSVSTTMMYNNSSISSSILSVPATSSGTAIAERRRRRRSRTNSHTRSILSVRRSGKERKSSIQGPIGEGNTSYQMLLPASPTTVRANS